MPRQYFDRGNAYTNLRWTRSLSVSHYENSGTVLGIRPIPPCLSFYHIYLSPYLAIKSSAVDTETLNVCPLPVYETVYRFLRNSA